MTFPVRRLSSNEFNEFNEVTTLKQDEGSVFRTDSGVDPAMLGREIREIRESRETRDGGRQIGGEA